MRVCGYLLDVNHVGPFIREDPGIMARARATPAYSLVWVCSVTLGEIEASHRGMTTTTNQQKRNEYISALKDKLGSFILDVSEHTPEYYGEIMGRIWKNDPPSPKVETEKHLLALGVDVNDVWAVAAAWEHGLTFLTSDEMACIRKAVDGDVQFDSWL